MLTAGACGAGCWTIGPVQVVERLNPDGFEPKIIARKPDYLAVEYESPIFGFVGEKPPIEVFGLRLTPDRVAACWPADMIIHGSGFSFQFPVGAAAHAQPTRLLLQTMWSFSSQRASRAMWSTAAPAEWGRATLTRTASGSRWVGEEAGPAHQTELLQSEGGCHLGAGGGVL